MTYSIDNALDGRGGEGQPGKMSAGAWSAAQDAKNGIWHVEGPHQHFAIRTELATVWGGGGDKAAMAHLMAAAPDLLAALNLALPLLEEDLREHVRNTSFATGWEIGRPLPDTFDAGMYEVARGLRVVVDAVRAAIARTAVPAAEGR